MKGQYLEDLSTNIEDARQRITHERAMHKQAKERSKEQKSKSEETLHTQKKSKHVFTSFSKNLIYVSFCCINSVSLKEHKLIIVILVSPQNRWNVLRE